MNYKRFKNNTNLTKEQKISLLNEYIDFYKKAISQHGTESLNIKLPRNIFEEILDKIGSILIEESINYSKKSIVKDFLKNNPVPPNMAKILPDEFRTFSLLLNALKQWISAESAATDRFLLGGTARATCRNLINECIVTGEQFDKNSELHHPLRDGRPPILLSKKGHDLLEHKNQSSINVVGDNLDILNKIKAIRTKRNMSWVQLREGCISIDNNLKPCRPGAKSFANKVVKETGLSPLEIIKLLNSINS